MHASQISAIDGWITMQGEAISRPEAIRRLVDLSLEGAMKQATRRAIRRLSSADQIALAEAATNPPPPKAKLRS